MIISIPSSYIFPYIEIPKSSTHVFFSTGCLISHTGIYGHGGVLCGMARNQGF